jgi:hypothetical protein
MPESPRVVVPLPGGGKAARDVSIAAERGAGVDAGPAAAAAPATDRCPRCGGTFHCGVNDAPPCACTGVTLDAALRRQLQARWRGCLCLSCLRALADGAPIEPNA